MIHMFDKLAYRSDLLDAIGRQGRRQRLVGASAVTLGVVAVAVSGSWLAQSSPDDHTVTVVSPPEQQQPSQSDPPEPFEFVAGRSPMVLVGSNANANGISVTEVDRGMTSIYSDVTGVVRSISDPDSGSQLPSPAGVPRVVGSVPNFFAWRDGVLFWPLGSERSGPSTLVGIPLDNSSGDGHSPLLLSEARSVAELDGYGRAFATTHGEGMWLTLTDHVDRSHSLYWLDGGGRLSEVLAPGPDRLVGVAGDDAVLGPSASSDGESGAWRLIRADGSEQALDPPEGFGFLGGTDRHLVWFGTSADGPLSGAELVIQERGTGATTVVESRDKLRPWVHVSMPTSTSAAGPLPQFSPDGATLVLGLLAPDTPGRGSRFELIELATGATRMIDLPTRNRVDSVFWGADNTLIAIVQPTDFGRQQGLLEIDIASGEVFSLGQVVPDGYAIVAAVPRNG